MSKYYDKIGYSVITEVERGIEEESYLELSYFGDIEKTRRKLTTEPQINRGIRLDMRVSVIADEYALSHFSNIRYATYLGQKWEAESVEVSVPRLILELGGVYHAGDTASNS